MHPARGSFVPLVTVLLCVVPTVAGAIPPITPAAVHVYTTPSKSVIGLVGSYVNQSLESYATQDDWRSSQVIAGSRIDATINFTSNGWGARAPLNLTGGTDADWDNFSVQWDGYLEVVGSAARFAISSDDGSRMWIDINHDNVFDTGGAEFIDNDWGWPHSIVTSPTTVLAPGLYKIRIQYCEDFFGNIMTLTGLSRETVRFAYVIPSDRSPQPPGVFAIQQMVAQTHLWFADQMDRFGMGSRSFHFETEADGTTPKIHVVFVAPTAESLRVDALGNDARWNRVGPAAQAAGITLWSDSEIWVLFPELFLETGTGAIAGGGLALGAGYGNGSAPGVAMLGTEKLSMTDHGGLIDDRSYHGLLFPQIGPFPLVYQTSFPGFEGSTISSVISSHVGALAHEMAHAFGVPHDFRNDDDFVGNLMGNGLRGIRGSLYPGRYPQDYTQLTLGIAAALSVNRFFEPGPPVPAFLAEPLGGGRALSDASGETSLPPRTPESAAAARYLLPDDRMSPGEPAGPGTYPLAGHRSSPSPLSIQTGPPAVTILTSGSVSPVGGLLPIHFQATGTRPLRQAWLIRDGNLVEDMALASTVVDATFLTTWYDAGGTSTYELHVFDTDGGRASASAQLTATSGGNHAPMPLIHAAPADVLQNQTVTLDASQSSDPNSPTAGLIVEWDTDGDFVFDTAPTTTKTLTKSYSSTGVRLIRARVTDPSGAQAISAPVAIRVRSYVLDVPAAPAGPRLALAVRPDPMRSGGHVLFTMPHAGAASLEVFDLQGRLEATLLGNGSQPAGVREIPWPASDQQGHPWRSGVHFCRLTVAGQSVVRRVVLIP